MRFSGRLRGGADGGDRNGVLAFEIEEYAVVATAETEAGERRLEFLYVAGAVGQVAIHAAENLQGGFAVDGAQIGTDLRLPDHGDPFRRWRFGHFPGRTRAGCLREGCLLRERAKRGHGRARQPSQT
jgi:hypothetical protein